MLFYWTSFRITGIFVAIPTKIGSWYLILSNYTWNGSCRTLKWVHSSCSKSPIVLHNLRNSRIINQNKLSENNTKLSSPLQRVDNWANKETFQLIRCTTNAMSWDHSQQLNEPDFMLYSLNRMLDQTKAGWLWNYTNIHNFWAFFSIITNLSIHQWVTCNWVTYL